MNVAVIFHCDQWQSYSSMRLIGVATQSQLPKVLRAIKKKLGYSKEDMETYIFVKECQTNDIKNMDI